MAWKWCYPIIPILEAANSQWCHTVQQVGPFTEVANNAGNTCMSVAPAAVFPALQEARKWVNHSKRRAHRIWWLKSVWMPLEIPHFWVVPVPSCALVCVQLWAIDWWWVRGHFQLLVFTGFKSGLGCKLHCPDVPCTPQERTKRRLHDDSGLPRACSATSWFINDLGASLDWCIPKERSGFPARSGAKAPAHGNGRAACMGQWVASQGAYPQYLGSWWMFVRSHSFETILNLVVYAISFFWCVCPSLDGNLLIWTFWLFFWQWSEAWFLLVDGWLN